MIIITRNALDYIKLGNEYNDMEDSKAFDEDELEKAARYLFHCFTHLSEEEREDLSKLDLL